MPTSHLGSRCMSKRITQSKSRLFFGSLADKTTRSRHVRLPPIADIRRCRWDVRKVPIAEVELSVTNKSIEGLQLLVQPNQSDCPKHGCEWRPQ